MIQRQQELEADFCRKKKERTKTKMCEANISRDEQGSVGNV